MVSSLTTSLSFLYHLNVSGLEPAETEQVIEPNWPISETDESEIGTILGGSKNNKNKLN
jgi:hypothetical protein